MQKMGMPPSWNFSEVYGFDEEMLGFIPQPVIAVILNAEYQKRAEEKERGDPNTTCSFYMKQTKELDNACGVIACLHAIYNNQDHIQLEDGKTLSNFYNMIKDGKSSAEIATALESYDDFKKQHKSFAEQG